MAEIASELAVHFEQAHDYGRAVLYLRQAAENGARRYANHEAIDCLTRALQHVDRLPEAEQPGCRAAVLEQLGLARRSSGDMRGAAEDFLKAALSARGQRDLNATIRTLLYAASALSWFERDRCLSVAGQAQTLSAGLAEQPLRAHVRGDAA